MNPRRLAGWFLDAAGVWKQTLAGARRRVDASAVALTFDDGPHPSSTNAILDVLEHYGVKATFFCVGRNVRAHPDIVRRALTEGHAIGSHSLSHPSPAETPLRQLAREYCEGRRALAAVAGHDTALFRPPHGHLAFPSAAMVRSQRLSPWLWSVDPQDWRPGITTVEVRSVATTAGPGDVILLHDWVEQPWAPQALDRSATIEALPGIIEGIATRGLRFTTLTP